MGQQRSSMGIDVATRYHHVSTEHHSLGALLDDLLSAANANEPFGRCRALLDMFVAQLHSHHVNENKLLVSLHPEHWKIHIGFHEELMSITSDLIKRCEQHQRVDGLRVEGLKILLERHIATLDSDLHRAEQQ